MIEEAIGLMEFQLKGKNITVEIDIDPEREVLVEKTSFINSVINNLITNAIKFSYPKSKIEIKEIRNSANNAGENFIEICIRDYGIGMSEKMVRDIFDVTKKTSRPGTNKEVGTGFGMPLVHQFVISYGGKIQITSTEESGGKQNDSGTEVTIFLKAALELDSNNREFTK